MSAPRLFEAGYQGLVSVIPPDAPLSNRSRVDPTQRGKCPGRKNATGHWYGYNFLRAEAVTAESAQEMARWGANVGLNGEHFPGLDIDCEDPRLTAAVRRLAEQHLGQAPVRTSRQPRALMVYRTEEPFGRVAAKITFGGQEHLVEFLGRGRQYLVHGMHPSGRPYGWEGPALWDVPAKNLTLVTLDGVEAFFDALEEALMAKGIPVERVGDSGADGPAPPQEDLRGPSPEEVARVVGEIPNGGSFADREDYIAMGHAIKAAAGEEGLDIFMEWCARWEGGENAPETIEADWGRMHPPFRIGWQWLLDKAAEHGYSSAQDEFQADPNAAQTDGPVRISLPGVIDFSDEWMVQMIRDRLSGELLYLPGANDQNGTWLKWNGHKWCVDRILGHERLIRRHLTGLGMQLQGIADAMPKKEAGTVRNAAARCQSRQGIGNVVALLRAHLARAEGTFDLDPYHLNTPEGVYDLRTGAVIEGDRTYRLATPFAPKPGPMPLWDSFLEDLTGGDPEYQEYLQKAMGYALTGDMSAKVFWFIWGSNSDTGKSTFVTTLQGIFGDYTSGIDVKAFLSSDANRLKPELAQLPGVRLVTATEPASGRAWDEETIKAITGGDMIQTRFLYGQPFTYNPQFKILVIGNHEPAIRGIDDAMKRRVRIMPFNIKVPTDRQVKDLADTMVKEEGPAILAWLVEGARRWREEGLNTPEVVVARTEAYTEEEDMMTEWVNEMCDFGEEYEVPRQTLFENWSRWMKARNRNAGSIQAFRQDFEERTIKLGIEDRRLRLSDGSKPRGYVGVRLRPRVQLGTEEFSV